MGWSTKVCKACKRNFRASENYIKKHECFCNECHHVPEMREKARVREEALDYDSAIKIWETLGEIEEAARVRKLKAKQSAVKVDQTVVHGNYVDDRDTIVKDSVVNKSNIGAGGKSKAEELREAKSLLDEGLINEDDYEKMKKEILGK